MKSNSSDGTSSKGKRDNSAKVSVDISDSQSSSRSHSSPRRTGWALYGIDKKWLGYVPKPIPLKRKRSGVLADALQQVTAASASANSNGSGSDSAGMGMGLGSIESERWCTSKGCEEG